ncbi:hemerythrin domain-containing protein [Hyalangium versicolor]|uniref:hemerythrin domain-containing protein n=1 Tax=Hyalangium versicolor TaxID=2861190 RepID=UPI001CC98C8A|nr:hemerythrin domain-containing protein [Hyalangium versicolor]
MDAIALLKADHKTVESLFRRFEQAGQNAKKLKRKLVDQMVRELAVHAVIEEEIFYPTVRAQVEKLNDDVLEALEEHHVVKWLLTELENLPPEAERFDAKVKVLIENVRTHVKEEEQELFPQVRRAFTPSELKDMAAALTLAKKAAPTRPHPRAPDTPPGNIVAGAMSSVLDMGKDAVDAARRKVQELTSSSTNKRRRGKRSGQGSKRGLRAQVKGAAQNLGVESPYLM